jgi:hypothetical protein
MGPGEMDYWLSLVTSGQPLRPSKEPQQIRYIVIGFEYNTLFNDIICLTYHCAPSLKCFIIIGSKLSRNLSSLLKFFHKTYLAKHISSQR